MKQIKTIISTLLILITLNAPAQDFNKKQIKEIHSFLVDFGEAAKAKDTLKLKGYIFPLYFNDTNYQDFAINVIVNNTQENSGRDYQYSDKAFAIIRDSLYHKFTPMTEEVRTFFNYPEESKIIIDNYKDNELAVYFDNKILIVILLDEKQFRFFFYEGMNRLLTE